MSAMVFSVGGVPVNVRGWDFGESVGGDGSAHVMIPPGEAPVRPGDTVSIGDASRMLWRGIVDSVTTSSAGQEIWSTSLTAIAAIPAPRFRFGDVITARNGNGRLFMVIAAAGDGLTTVLPLGETDLMHDQRLRPDEWEIVE